MSRRSARPGNGVRYSSGRFSGRTTCISRSRIRSGEPYPGRRPQFRLYSRRLPPQYIAMEYLPSPSSEQQAAEEREALRKTPPLTGHALFVDLVRKGLINARGEVTRLIGGSAEPEPNRETWTGEKPPRKKAQ